MPHFVSPRGFKTSLKTRMAFGMPDVSVLYVSTSSVGFYGYVSPYALNASYSDGNICTHEWAIVPPAGTP